MSPDVMTWTLAALLSVRLQSAAAPCGAEAHRALAAVAEAAVRGDEAGAAGQASAADARAATCRDLRLAAWAWRGWSMAMSAADRGGTAESLIPVKEAIDAATALGPPRSAAAYVVALLRASAAAAQDERDEMALWLDEARATSRQLALVGPAPSVPWPVDLAEGELWLGVDDYELAVAAFSRALAGHDTPAGWRGIARASDRRGDRARACGAYRNVAAALARQQATSPLTDEARDYLRRCAP